MKHIRLLAATILAVSFLVSSVFAKDAMVRSPRQCGESRGEDTALDVDIAFSENAGQTITDENGTTFCAYGYTDWEAKVYPPEYWGVFPLYFVGDNVGILVTVKNDSDDRDAQLRVTTECYSLETDGGNGVRLLSPVSRDIAVPKQSTVSFNGSFVVEPIEGSESGLDRFLVKIYESGLVTYQVVRNAQNWIKFENAAPGLGEDGAKEKDTFVIGVDNVRPSIEPLPAGEMPPMPVDPPPVSLRVTTKAGNASATSVVTEWEAGVHDSLGFLTTLVSVGENSVVLTVESVDNTLALSHVEFEFIEGASVCSPASGATSIQREALRNEDSTLIMVKEGIFCPPGLDNAIMDSLGSILGE